MTQDQGILYVATGPTYVAEAAASARTFEQHVPEIPRAILLDDAGLLEKRHPFDEVGTIASPKYALSDKTDQLKRSPFSRTLFVDTDCFCVAPCGEVFDLLERCDVAVAHAPVRWSQYQPEGVPACYPDFNTGVIAFRSSDEFTALVDRWAEQMIRDVQVHGKAANDQPAFRAAMYDSSLRVAVLPAEYNLRTVWPCLIGGNAEVKILHGRGESLDRAYRYLAQPERGNPMSPKLADFRKGSGLGVASALQAGTTVVRKLGRAAKGAAKSASTEAAKTATLTVKRAGKAPQVSWDNMVRGFELDDLTPLTEGWQQRPPDFVGVGVPKAGTSWLYDLMLKHPRIEPTRLWHHGPGAKELQFFTHTMPATAVDAQRETYLSAFAAPPGSLCGEFSTLILHHPTALANLARCAPDTQIIVELRHPVDRMASHINHLIVNRARRLRIDQRGDDFELFKRYSCYPEAFYFSLYANAIEKLLSLFPRERVHVLLYEHMKRDPLGEVRKLLENLGLNGDADLGDGRTLVNAKAYAIEKFNDDERANLWSEFVPDVQRLCGLLPEIDFSVWEGFEAAPPLRQAAA